MSRRDARAAGQTARHARERLEAALGEPSSGLPGEHLALEGFEYTGAPAAGADTGNGPGGKSPGAPMLRWRVGLRVAVLLAVLAVAAGAWFWFQAGAAAPEVLPLNAVSAGGSTGVPNGGEGQGQDASTPAALVVVHVAGAVAKPGVIRLQQGSRTDDAIAAAGGATPDGDLNRLNLALVVEDGQKIYVPRQGEALPAAPDASGPRGAESGEAEGQGQSPGAGGKVNLNTAGAAELDTLPKVGPVLAQRIVDWRNEHGPFTSVEELDAVDGVGPKMLEALLPLVTV